MTYILVINYDEWMNGLDKLDQITRKNDRQTSEADVIFVL